MIHTIKCKKLDNIYIEQLLKYFDSNSKDKQYVVLSDTCFNYNIIMFIFTQYNGLIYITFSKYTEECGFYKINIFKNDVENKERESFCSNFIDFKINPDNYDKILRTSNGSFYEIPQKVKYNDNFKFFGEHINEYINKNFIETELDKEKFNKVLLDIKYLLKDNKLIDYDKKLKNSGIYYVNNYLKHNSTQFKDEKNLKNFSDISFIQQYKYVHLANINLESTYDETINLEINIIYCNNDIFFLFYCENDISSIESYAICNLAKYTKIKNLFDGNFTSIDFLGDSFEYITDANINTIYKDYYNVIFSHNN